jgi:pimeloyl-ACP methyl ester carboxylesterase
MWLRHFQLWALVVFVSTAQLHSAESGGGGPQSIQIGDHSLRFAKGGAGGPTVVFEAGMGGGIPPFRIIAERLNQLTTTIRYAHAEPTVPFKRTPKAVATELRALLEAAKIPPPYILVGHSMGGIHIRAFATMFPGDVCGMVLVDPSHERMLAHNSDRPALFAERFSDTTTAEGVAALGVIEILTSGRFEEGRTMPAVPITIITALRPPAPDSIEKEPEESVRRKRALHSELFQQVAYGRHVVTNKSGHMVMREDPDVVLDAIRWTLETVRAQQSGAPKQPAHD